MKKFLLSMACAALAAMPLMAQNENTDANTVLNNPANHPYFGIRLGSDIVCPGKITEGNVSLDAFNVGGGVDLGAIYNIPVVANFYIEPGVRFYYANYGYKDEWIEEMAPGADIDEVCIDKFGMRIPVMAGYHFDFTPRTSLSVFTGPEFEIGFSAKEKAKSGRYEESASIYEDGGMKRFDLIWGVGAGITYRHFYFGLSGGIGLLNMMDDSDIKFHENRVTLTLGYNF